MSIERWKWKLVVVGGALVAMLGNASSVLADGPPPPPPSGPHLVPATGAVVVIGGLVGYAIYRLSKRR